MLYRITKTFDCQRFAVLVVFIVRVCLVGLIGCFNFQASTVRCNNLKKKKLVIRLKIEISGKIGTDRIHASRVLSFLRRFARSSIALRSDARAQGSASLLIENNYTRLKVRVRSYASYDNDRFVGARSLYDVAIGFFFFISSISFCFQQLLPEYNLVAVGSNNEGVLNCLQLFVFLNNFNWPCDVRDLRVTIIEIIMMNV